MKVFSKTVEIQTSKRLEFVKLDEKVQRVVEESGVGEGFALLRCSHTTGALVCNEDDSTIHRDFAEVFNRLVPEDLPYEHTMEGKVNARAHQLSMLLGTDLWVPIQDGRLQLGTWQSLFFVELFEPRRRKVEVLVLGE